MRGPPQIALVVALLATTPMPALAHAHLAGSAPAADTTVPAPARLSLTFTQALEKRFATVQLQDSAGKPVDGVALQNDPDPTRLNVGLPTALPAGTYTVIWHVTSVDTHRTDGHFSFTVGR